MGRTERNGRPLGGGPGLPPARAGRNLYKRPPQGKRQGWLINSVVIPRIGTFPLPMRLYAQPEPWPACSSGHGRLHNGHSGRESRLRGYWAPDKIGLRPGTRGQPVRDMACGSDSRSNTGKAVDFLTKNCEELPTRMGERHVPAAIWGSGQS